MLRIYRNSMRPEAAGCRMMANPATQVEFGAVAPTFMVWEANPCPLFNEITTSHFTFLIVHLCRPTLVLRCSASFGDSLAIQEHNVGGSPHSIVKSLSTATASSLLLSVPHRLNRPASSRKQLSRLQPLTGFFRQWPWKACPCTMG